MAEAKLEKKGNLEKIDVSGIKTWGQVAQEEQGHAAKEATKRYDRLSREQEHQR